MLGAVSGKEFFDAVVPPGAVEARFHPHQGMNECRSNYSRQVFMGLMIHGRRSI